MYWFGKYIWRKFLTPFLSLQAFIGKISHLIWFSPLVRCKPTPKTSEQNSTLTTLPSQKSILAAICCRFLGFLRSFCSNTTGILHSSFLNKNPPELYTKA